SATVSTTLSASLPFIVGHVPLREHQASTSQPMLQQLAALPSYSECAPPSAVIPASSNQSHDLAIRTAEEDEDEEHQTKM
ncbi:hypothetical protein PMAYCL1PPCAC_19516, partial [Pristionchus mayeri]